MNEQKLKPGHFWAEVWGSGTNIYKRIVIDICGKGCVAVAGGYEEEYFNNEKYNTSSWKNFQKLEPPKMRYMTNEEMAEFVLENPCIIRNKKWHEECWVMNIEMNSAIDPKDWLWKKRFSDEWQEFLIEDKES